MAQALFDALSGVASMDNQTALAVQTLLESQSVAESAQVEEEDVFQCGKCKKQFNSLPSFVAHKQSRCSPASNQTLTRAEPQQAPVSVYTTQGLLSNKQLQAVAGSSYSQTLAVPPSPLGQNTVLTDELIFTNIDQSMQMGNGGIQNNFLSQVVSGPFTSRASPGTPVTMVTPSTLVPPSYPTTSVFSTAGLNNAASTFQLPSLQTNNNMVQTVQGVNIVEELAQQHQVLHAPQPQTVVGTTVNPGNKTVTIIPMVKPSPTKAGRKLSNSQNLITVLQQENGEPTLTSVPKTRRTRLGGAVTADEGAGKKMLKCQYCDKTFNKNFDLQQHVRSHTGEKPFQCIVCGRAFAQKSNVKKHMQTHKVWPQGTRGTLPKDPARPVQEIDEEEGEDDDLLPERTEVHLSNENTGVSSNIQLSVEKTVEKVGGEKKVNIMVDNSYVCQYCGKKYKNYFQLKSHMSNHKDIQVYKCILKSCGSTFRELDEFLEHTKTHEMTMSYRCHMCNKLFPSLLELGVHQYSHSLYPNQGPKTGPRYFRCTKCNSKYATPESLQHHMETTSHDYPCQYCPKIFPCERYLRRHLPTHGTLGQYECHVCQKTFKMEHYLKMHLLTHSDERPFKCDHCPAAFNRKDKLKRHCLIHEPHKRYKCPFRSHTGCLKEFNRPDKLKAHIISHSGIKPYKCKICGRAFSRRAHLNEHQRKHTNDYKFSCDKCDRGFLRERLLQQHKCRPQAVDSKETVAHLINSEKTVLEPVRTLSGVRGRSRRKVRQRARYITVTEETLKANRSTRGRRRGRPRNVAKILEIPDSPSPPPIEEDNSTTPHDESVVASTNPPLMLKTEDGIQENNSEPIIVFQQGVVSKTEQDQNEGMLTSEALAESQQSLGGAADGSQRIMLGNNMVIITPLTDTKALQQEGIQLTGDDRQMTLHAQDDGQSVTLLGNTPSDGQSVTLLGNTPSGGMMFPQGMQEISMASLGGLQMVPTAGGSLTTLVVDSVSGEIMYPDGSHPMVAMPGSDGQTVATVAYVTSDQLESLQGAVIDQQTEHGTVMEVREDALHGAEAHELNLQSSVMESAESGLPGTLINAGLHDSGLQAVVHSIEANNAAYRTHDVLNSSTGIESTHVQSHPVTIMSSQGHANTAVSEHRHHPSTVMIAEPSMAGTSHHHIIMSESSLVSPHAQLMMPDSLQSGAHTHMIMSEASHVQRSHSAGQTHMIMPETSDAHMIMPESSDAHSHLLMPDTPQSTTLLGDPSQVLMHDTSGHVLSQNTPSQPRVILEPLHNAAPIESQSSVSYMTPDPSDHGVLAEAVHSAGLDAANVQVMDNTGQSMDQTTTQTLT